MFPLREKVPMRLKKTIFPIKKRLLALRAFFLRKIFPKLFFQTILSVKKRFRASARLSHGEKASPAAFGIFSFSENVLKVGFNP